MKVSLYPAARFREWLSEEGAIFLTPTNPYEILRYTSTANRVGLVHRNDRNSSVKLSGAAPADYTRFLGRDSTPPRIKGPARDSVVQRLIDRDGPTCFFCGAAEPLTIEHILPRSAGGTNRRENLALACQPCNSALDNRPVVEKFRFYLRKQKELTS